MEDYSLKYRQVLGKKCLLIKKEGENGCNRSIEAEGVLNMVVRKDNNIILYMKTNLSKEDLKIEVKDDYREHAFIILDSEIEENKRKGGSYENK